MITCARYRVEMTPAPTQRWSGRRRGPIVRFSKSGQFQIDVPADLAAQQEADEPGQRSAHLQAKGEPAPFRFRVDPVPRDDHQTWLFGAPGKAATLNKLADLPVSWA
jgi:hypothetical protein